MTCSIYLHVLYFGGMLWATQLKKIGKKRREKVGRLGEQNSREAKTQGSRRPATQEGPGARAKNKNNKQKENARNAKEDRIRAT